MGNAEERVEGAPVSGEWGRRVHHLIWETYTRMSLLAEEQFDEAELTMATTGTLDLIGTWPGSTVADLSRRTPKTQQAISQLVAKLEKRGYVERRVGQGRGLGLYLTDVGAEARAAGNALELEFEERLLELFGDDLYEQIGAVLQRARARLDA
jgi:DNA-binding MarR family transcriptional regulator